MTEAELIGKLRPKTGAIAAEVKGLAMVRSVAYLLRRGEVKVHVTARDQHVDRLSIVAGLMTGA